MPLEDHNYIHPHEDDEETKTLVEDDEDYGDARMSEEECHSPSENFEEEPEYSGNMGKANPAGECMYGAAKEAIMENVEMPPDAIECPAPFRHRIKLDYGWKTLLRGMR